MNRSAWGSKPQPTYWIEPFDLGRHDRTGFSCGVAAVDNYFRKTANKLAEAGTVRLFVIALVILVVRIGHRLEVYR